MRKCTYLLLLMVFAVACNNATAQRITMTIAGPGWSGSVNNNGPAKLAQVTSTYICSDRSGNIYFSGGGTIRVISAKTGIVSNFAGGGTSTADGIPATDASISATSICCDLAGMVYLVTGSSFLIAGHTVKVVNPTTGIISTYAGTASGGFSGDGGPATAAQFSGIKGIASDALGNIYLADNGNNRVRRIDAVTKIVTTMAGSGLSGYAGDGGPATAAALADISYIACNSAGDVFFVDQNGTYIRKVSATTGLITAYAGGGGEIDGYPATAITLGPISGMCINASDNICFNELSCSCREINHLTDTARYIGGDFGTESYKDDTNSLYAWMNNQSGLASDMYDNVFVCDNDNARIRKLIKLTHAPAFAYGLGQTIIACPGYSYFVDSLLAVADLDMGQTETWSLITPPAVGSLSGLPATHLSDSVFKTVKPAGISYLAPSAYTGADSFIVRVTDGTYSDTFTLYVRVQMPNVGVISGPAAICGVGTIDLAETVTGGVWTASNGTATVTASGHITGVAGGIDTISYTPRYTGCSLGAAYTVTVTPMPNAGAIAGGAEMCAGSILVLTDAATGGSWSVSNSSASVSGIGAVLGLSAGVDTIMYSVSNSCGTAIAARGILIDPLPEAGIITGPDTLCQGAVVTLADTASGGVWSDVSGAVTLFGGGMLSGVSAGVDTIKYAVTNGCGTAIAVLPVLVNPLPDPGSISGIDNVCIGASITLSDGIAGGIWSQTNSDLNMPAPGTFTGLTAGADTIVYAVTNTCGTSFANKIIMVNDCIIEGVASQQEQEISIFPNPANSIVNIQWSKPLDGDAVVVLRDVAGREVLRSPLRNSTNASSMHLDIAGLGEGVYVISVSSGSVNFTNKLVIAK